MSQDAPYSHLNQNKQKRTEAFALGLSLSLTRKQERPRKIPVDLLQNYYLVLAVLENGKLGVGCLATPQ
jgi:hypothetical protein